MLLIVNFAVAQTPLVPALLTARTRQLMTPSGRLVVGTALVFTVLTVYSGLPKSAELSTCTS